MPSLQPIRIKQVTDHQLERRIALALLSVRISKLRFVHVHVSPWRSLRLVLSRNQLLEIDAHGGQVKLGGVLNGRIEREQLKSLVRRVPGVVEVVDEFSTTSAERVTAHSPKPAIVRLDSGGFDDGSAPGSILLPIAG